jgi:hypothetical protein
MPPPRLRRRPGRVLRRAPTTRWESDFGLAKLTLGCPHCVGKRRSFERPHYGDLWPQRGGQPGFPRPSRVMELNDALQNACLHALDTLQPQLPRHLGRTDPGPCQTGMHGRRSPDAELFDDTTSLAGKDLEATLDAITVFVRAIPASRGASMSTQVTCPHGRGWWGHSAFAVAPSGAQTESILR